MDRHLEIKDLSLEGLCRATMETGNTLAALLPGVRTKGWKGQVASVKSFCPDMH